TTSEDPRIRFYSGTACYSRTFHWEDTGGRVWLETGDPGSVARVRINGCPAGIVWCSPWTVEVTDSLVERENMLEIDVANCLTNRMIYDASLPVQERITYAYPPVVSSKDSLSPSGLRTVRLIGL
ncbi:MAG: glycosyl hydrolase family 2, partial [Rikenellaceae bacterium]|nr:glycosyl hydrolase family 2 [Rikenellaceae bacterium]